jgi:hypothetical protein
MSGMDTEWDHRVPTTVADVISLLERRIEVHKRWRDWLATDPDEAGDAKRLGGGTVESHDRYIAQYRGAIDAVEGRATTPYLLRLDDQTAVKIGGSRFDGWLFRKHPDGQWISVRKLEREAGDG